MAVGLGVFACKLLLIMVLVVYKCGHHSKFGIHSKLFKFDCKLEIRKKPDDARLLIGTAVTDSN